MAYVLKRNIEEVKEDDLRSDEFTHEPTGIKATINSFANPAYQRAYERIFLREKEQTKALFDAKLDDDFLDEAESTEMTTNELWLRAIGRFLIVEWNINDEDGNMIEPNGDSFILLLSDLDNPPEFARWCLDCATAVAINRDEVAAETKKKPLPATRGKKTTATRTRKTSKSTNTSE